MDVKLSFLVAAGIAIFGAIIHFVAPLMGPEWYAYLQAPPQIVESAKQGTWLAPVSGLAIGGAMLLAGLYALSGARLMKYLPLTKPALIVLALLCVLRGLLIIPAMIKVPELIEAFDIVASVIWFLAGLGYTYGLIRTWPALGRG